MVEKRERRPHVSISSGLDFEAEIYVIEGHRKIICIEAADLPEHRSAQNQASPRHRRYVGSKCQPRAIAYAVALKIPKCVVGSPA